MESSFFPTSTQVDSPLLKLNTTGTSLFFPAISHSLLSFPLCSLEKISESVRTGAFKGLPTEAPTRGKIENTPREGRKGRKKALRRVPGGLHEVSSTILATSNLLALLERALCVGGTEAR